MARIKIDGVELHASITDERVIAAVERSHLTLDSPGFCIFCGDEAMGVEPDAARYRCDFCEKDGVYGAEDLLIRMVI